MTQPTDKPTPSRDIDRAPGNDAGTPGDESTKPGGEIPMNELDVVKYFIPPTLGHLDIHGWDSVTTLENLNSILQNKWRAEQGAKALVYRAYGGRIDDKEEVTKLRKMIKSTLNVSEPGYKPD